MKIIVEANMPFGREAFETLGDVEVVNGRTLTNEQLAEVEVMAIRSTTKVTPELLDGTPVKYIGTATIGTDHFDMDYMDAHGIKYCNAPGCNADSVADYITATLLLIARDKNMELAGKSIGVVGCGNVGSRVVKRAEALGMTVVQNDPPLLRETARSDQYRPIDEVMDCDFITLHTPLTREGEDATYHLADASFFERMKDTAILINASRGAVVDCDALDTALREKTIAGAALDVWEGEPCIDTELMNLTLMATPHIAGYSYEGKVNGTVQVYEQICEWINAEATWDVAPLMPAPEVPELTIDATGRSDQDVISEAVFAVYPIDRDDRDMREAHADGDDDTRRQRFDALRKGYPVRREFSYTTLKLKSASEGLKQALSGLTFETEMID
jgi:erythronate-4-phosphate dehydrogenase